MLTATNTAEIIAAYIESDLWHGDDIHAIQCMMGTIRTNRLTVDEITEMVTDWFVGDNDTILDLMVRFNAELYNLDDEI